MNSTFAPTPAPSVFYVLRREVRNYYLSAGHYVPKLKDAKRFRTVAGILQYIAENASNYNGYLTSFNISRVEEITTAPKRELVTSGDLSLLNGPCVVQYGKGLSSFLGTNPPKTEAINFRASLKDAAIFPNQAGALTAVMQLGKIGGYVEAAHPYSIVPVREVPGATEFKETVLA